MQILPEIYHLKVAENSRTHYWKLCYGLKQVTVSPEVLNFWNWNFTSVHWEHVWMFIQNFIKIHEGHVGTFLDIRPLGTEWPYRLLQCIFTFSVAEMTILNLNVRAEHCSHIAHLILPVSLVRRELHRITLCWQNCREALLTCSALPPAQWISEDVRV